MALKLVSDRPSNYLIKEVPFIKQNPYCCGPAAAEMVLNYYGITNFDQKTIASCDVSNPTGTNWKKLFRYLNHNGKKNGFGVIKINGNKNIIKKHIASGYPIIVRQWLNNNKDERHYRVVTGYDDAKQIFIYNDSSERPNMTLSYKTFLNYWNVQLDDPIYSTKNMMLVIVKKAIKN